jgi:hypothetical protein
MGRSMMLLHGRNKMYLRGKLMTTVLRLFSTFMHGWIGREIDDNDLGSFVCETWVYYSHADCLLPRHHVEGKLALDPLRLRYGSQHQG